jgi:hypothetical protein
MIAECDAEDVELVADTSFVALAEAVESSPPTKLRMLLTRSLSPGIVQTTKQT